MHIRASAKLKKKGKHISDHNCLISLFQEEFVVKSVPWWFDLEQGKCRSNLIEVFPKEVQHVIAGIVKFS